jgi:hypothetical protein
MGAALLILRPGLLKASGQPHWVTSTFYLRTPVTSTSSIRTPVLRAELFRRVRSAAPFPAFREPGFVIPQEKPGGASLFAPFRAFP